MRTYSTMHFVPLPEGIRVVINSYMDPYQHNKINDVAIEYSQEQVVAIVKDMCRAARLPDPW